MSTIHDLFRPNGSNLSALVCLDDGPEGLWQSDELASIWLHQLRAPLEVATDLNQTISASAVNATRAGQPSTFGELFHHSSPSLELLKRVKEFGKHHRTDPGSTLPREIVTMLYYASIGIALFRCGTRITSLSDHEIQKGIEWAIAEPWVDKETRSLLRQVLSSQKEQDQR